VGQLILLIGDPKNIIFIEKQGFQKHIPSGK
jgi:hypothetical protein